MTLLVVTVLCALAIGVTMGLLGAGGSILTVPLLTLVAGLSPRSAIATSLFAVMVTAAVSAAVHARAGRVRWRVGLVFGLAGMAGAYGGASLSVYLSERALMICFGVVMTMAAVAMLRGRRGGDGTARDVTPSGRALVLIAVEGVVIGGLTGLIGAGGGFIIVPTLVLLTRLPMHAAVGTSLMVISMNAGSGLMRHLGHVSIDWPVAAAITAALVAGSLLGVRLSSEVQPERLRRGFGWFVIAVAAFVLINQA